MDIRIKGARDGIETARIVRERFDIPVIYLTAQMDQRTIDQAKMTGACGFLTKPVHSANLAVAVEMAIHKHKTDHEVRHQRAWMATVLGTMPDAMIVVNRDGRIQFLNSPAEVLTGWTNEDARNRDLSVVLPLRDSTRADDILSPESEPQARHMPRGLMAIKRSGERFPVEGAISPSIDEGKVVGAVITFRDATARQAEENEIRQQDKMQAVGRLAAGIAHDFNNLLFIMLGYTDEVLLAPALRDSDVLALKQIKKAGETATGITQQLLKFSRKEKVEKQDVDLNEVIREWEELLRRVAGRSVRCQFKLDRGLKKVRADPGQLKQVLVNLVANARDAMPESGVLTIETDIVDLSHGQTVEDEKETCIALSVTDTGSGMSEETAEHLFEPFFTTKEPGRGTGLGLSIVHSIITDLGGSIHVESAPGKGATFSIYFPLAGTASAVPVVEAPPPRGSSDPATVLLVEDQEGVRNLLRNYVESFGCRVLAGENGEEGIRIGNEYAGTVDLLITDVMMPRVGGLEVSKVLAQRWPEMKVIFISGYAQELVDGLENLPSDARYLPKPFAKTDLS